MSLAIMLRIGRASLHSEMGHLWLIGMMGSGKSTVGSLVAEQLQVPHLDVDALIVERSQRSVAEIFTEGEATFRALESAEITALAEQADAVIATGGGAVLKSTNVEAMRKSGATILLTASLECLEQRMRNSVERPLLAEDGALARIYETRAQLYRESADIVIDTTDLDAVSVSEEVLRCVAT